MRTLLIALALTLLAAAPAGAAVTTIDARGPDFVSQSTFSGPVVAGGRVYWGVRNADGSAVLRSADAAGKRVDLLRLPADRTENGFVHVSASDEYVLLQRVGHHCRFESQSPCKDPRMVSNEAWAGPIGGPLTKIFSCAPKACGDVSEPGETPCPPTASYSVSGRFAVSEPACTNRLYVYDLAAPGSPPQMYGGAAAAAAGRYLATISRSLGGARLGVLDRESGEAFGFPVPAVSVLVQDDGTVVVWRGSSSSESFWASPAERSLHPIPGVTDPPVALAGGRLSTLGAVTGEGNRMLERRLTTYDLAGNVLSSGRAGPGIGGVGFDTARIAWAVVPCQTTFIVVKPLGERAADAFTDHSTCPVPAVRRPQAGLDASGKASVKATCPATERLGCPGLVGLSLTRPVRRQLASSGYALGPGESMTLPVALTKADRVAVKRAGGARLSVRFIVPPRSTVASGRKPRERVAYVSLKPARR